MTKETKAMTTAQTVSAIAEETGLSRKQVGYVLEKLAAMACREAKNGFKIPGIGKLVLVDRKARIGRNPKTGETIEIPARKAVKFRVSGACKAAVLGGGK